MLSIIIPARNERYLSETISNLRSNADWEIEIIAVLDGGTEYAHGSPDILITNPEPLGIRACINQAVEASSGDYIMKVDAHCIFGHGYDLILKHDCADNWVVVARRYTLDTETMERAPRIVDYYYLSCPWTYPRGFMMMQSCPWISRTESRMDIPIDDLMCFQGSMWFMSTKHWKRLGGLQSDLTFAEHHEISMKTWLSGGRVVINKNTWYAHPSSNLKRGYYMSMNTVYKDHELSAKHWTGNNINGYVHDFGWLIDKFWPLPTEDNHHRIEKYIWPADWRKYYDGTV